LASAMCPLLWSPTHVRGCRPGGGRPSTAVCPAWVLGDPWRLHCLAIRDGSHLIMYKVRCARIRARLASCWMGLRADDACQPSCHAMQCHSIPSHGCLPCCQGVNKLAVCQQCWAWEARALRELHGLLARQPAGPAHIAGNGTTGCAGRAPGLRPMLSKRTPAALIIPDAIRLAHPSWLTDWQHPRHAGPAAALLRLRGPALVRLACAANIAGS
jgi:hypothetical protein